MTTILLNNHYKSIFCTLALLFSITASQTLVAATLSAGGSHTCLIKHDGTLACWGITEDGRATPPTGTFSQVSVGWDHACALRTDNTLICWGRKGTDQPAPLAGNFSQVSAGSNYTCVLRTDGIPTCWGDNSDGQTAPPAGTFTQISTGWYHACGIKTDKTVVCWGRNDYQQATPPEGEFSQVTTNGYHSCGIKTDGTVVCWGNTSSNKAIRPPSGTFTQIAAGFKYTCGIKTDSTLVCWGDNDYGQTLFPQGTFGQVSAGYLYACGVKSDGTVTCWGDNSEGQAAPPFEVTSNCTYHLEPASYSHAAAASKGTVTVTASAAECPWTVSSQVDWVTMMSGDGGRGSGLVTYAVAANSNEQNRAGVLLIAGQPFTVSQWTNATLPVDTQNAFSMPVTAEAIKTVSQNLSVQTPPKEFRAQTFPITLPNTIYGLSITGQFGLRLGAVEDDPAAFVRVVLVDNNTQSEYLVYEKSLQSLTTEEYNSPRPLKIVKVCEETCVLPQPLNSLSLRLEVRHGVLSIDEVSYVETPVAADTEELRAKQNAVRIWQLNEQDLGWIAGETSVSNLSYAEKKRLTGLADAIGEFNLQGLEYYRGGVFELKLEAQKARNRGTRQSSVVANFSWTNQHEKNWVTPVKNQKLCGSCWAFTTTGTLEAAANLYFNQLLNLDLAEQDTLSCSGAGNCEQGGWIVGALDYFKSHGITGEGCFVYSATDQPCGNKQCNDPLFKPSGLISWGKEYPRTEDGLKRMIIESGPLSSGISSLSHAMMLVGFQTDATDGRTIWIFRNSWGEKWGSKTPGKLSYGERWGEYWQQAHGEANGYAYVKLNLDNILAYTTATQTPIVSSQPLSVNCVDQDNDTFCNWGISKDKPSTCPASCKPEKDCDDSNPELTVFDANYNCTGKPQPQPPIAMFTANPLKGVMPLKVTFDAGGSSDPDGTIATYQWAIDGQSVGTGNPFTYNFDKPGQFEVSLTVTDQQGLTVITKKVVTVVGQYSPVAKFVISPANTGEVPFNVTLNAGGSYDLDGKIVSYQWHSSEGQTASGKDAALTFNTPGSHSITLTVTDNDNLTGQTPKEVVATGTNVLVNVGIITTVAGKGSYGGFSGDGGPATNAQLKSLSGMAIDSSGNLYIADQWNQRIRKVDTAGNISTVVGSDKSGFSGDGGSATSAQLNSPRSVAVDSKGNLYISDSGNYRVRKIDTAGIITTVAGNGTGGFSGDGGPATSAKLSLDDIILDSNDNLYIVDDNNIYIRKVDTAGNISTVAGNGEYGFSGDGGPATGAQFSRVEGIAVDSNGNLYINDSSNYRIRKVDTAGIISTVAGNGTRGFSGDGGVATSAQLDPSDIAIDSNGNLYIAMRSSHRIRKVDTAGIISTVAGNGTEGFSGDGGVATSARLSYPDGVAIDSNGNLYIADSLNYRIRKVTFNNLIPCTHTYTFTPTTVTHSYDSETGTITVNAPTGCFWTVTSNEGWISITSGETGQGNGTVTYSVSNNIGTMVSPGMPTKNKNRSGTLTIAGQTVTINQVGEADCTYTVTPTTVTHGYGTETGDITITAPAGCPWNATSNVDWITIASEKGKGEGWVTYSVNSNSPECVNLVCPPSQSRSGTIAVAGQTVTISQYATPVQTVGIITTVAGNGESGFSLNGGISGDGGAAISTGFNPRSITIDSNGNLYIADSGSNTIRKVDTRGIISTVAGNGKGGFSGDGGPATSAQLFDPSGVTIDSIGNLYVVGGNRIRKVDTTGIITTVAGNGVMGSSGDGGPATSASLCIPMGVAVDSTGNLYIADSGCDRIRKVDTTGNISTIVGTESGFGGDGGPATNAQLNRVKSIAVDSHGNLYIVDFFNNRVRKVDTAGIISTIAGNGSSGYSGDGGPAINAQLTLGTSLALYSAGGIAIDSNDNLYIADSGNDRIRKVDTTGIISTVAGKGAINAYSDFISPVSPSMNMTGPTFSGDGGPATEAQLDNPIDVAVDRNGNLYIADSNNNRIRKVTFSNSTQPKVEVANPIVSQTIYQTGETLRVTLPSLPTGQEQYVGIGFPNGSIELLNQLNSFIPFDNVTFPVWPGGEVAIDKPITADQPSGLYTVYLLRMPTGVSPSSVKMEDWALGSAVFNINHTACTYTVTPANISHSTQSETGTVTVNAPAGCPWTATSNAQWITITSENSGQGNGTVTYSVKSNFSECVSPSCPPSQSRSGTMTIAGQMVTVNQQGER